MTELLWAACDELTKPRHVKLLRDDGSADWTTVPSLWWQLEDAVHGCGDAGSDSSGHSSRYRAPTSIDCLELHITIRDIVVDALAGHDQRPRPTVPDSVRALASLVVAATDDDLTGWWTYRVRSWCRQIETVLRLTVQPQPRRIRDTRCPTCGASHVTLDGPDGPERVPALLIDFADGLIRAASCTACGSTWFRGQALWDLADRLAAPDAGVTGEVDVVC